MALKNLQLYSSIRPHFLSFDVEIINQKHHLKIFEIRSRQHDFVMYKKHSMH